MRLLQGLIVGAVMSGSLSIPANAAPGVVRIDSGELEGVVAGEIVSFKNIPYAAPPIGELRWRAPQPVTAWQGVRKADKVGALCMQKYNPTDNGVGPLPSSEDCLS
jgi:para-nitrobenzyl esterase